MIYDCFIFYNENDVLDIRFEELYPVVDKFVVVQSNKTFRGVPKPDYFDYERFRKYEDKIRHVVHTPEIYGNDPRLTWDREEYQRNGILVGLWDAAPDDIVIISDADEIARRAVIKDIQPDGVVSLLMDVYCAYINWLTPNEHTIKVCRRIDIDTPHNVRKAARELVIPHSGWEFSSLGSPEYISAKLSSFAHHELDRPEVNDVELIRDRLARGEDPFGWGQHYRRVEVDDSWPEAIKGNRDYWRKFEWKTE